MRDAQSAQPPTGSTLADRESPSEPAQTIEAAIVDIARWTQELTSTLAKPDPADVARASNELERALSRGQVAADSLPRVSQRALALHRLDHLRAEAALVLATTAPHGSTAVEAVEVGDGPTWTQEEQTGIARGVARDSSPRRRRRRTHPRDTLPDSPPAFRDVSGDAGDGDVRRRIADQFDQDVKRAFENFRAEIIGAAGRAAVDGLRVAFARLSPGAGRGVTARGDDTPPYRGPAPRRLPARITRAAVQERVVECIRRNPGWNLAQLISSLGVPSATLRRHLRRLMRSDAIRIEERPAGFGGRRRRIYFVVGPGHGAYAEPSAIPAEPSAAPEAMA